MSTSRPLRWLHLSDLHLGRPGRSRWWTVHDAFAKHLRESVAEVGAPDVVLITGDLTSAATREQYDEVDSLLDALASWCGSAPIVIAVPGNHDVQRPRRARTYRVLRDLHRGRDDSAVAELLDELWTDRDASFIEPLFTEYSAWLERRVLAQGSIAGVRVTKSHFPGDLMIELDIPGVVPARFVGLNTAWCQYAGSDEAAESYRGRLDVSLEQYHMALGAPAGENPYARLREDPRATILLMHHPPAWLSPGARERYFEGIHDPEQIAICLHGHLHDARTEYLSSAGGRPRYYFQAPSLFGFENYGRANEERQTGYAIGELSVDGELRVWPFKGYEKGDGALGFDRDTSFYWGSRGVVIREGVRAHGPRPSSGPNLGAAKGAAPRDRDNSRPPGRSSQKAKPMEMTVEPIPIQERSAILLASLRTALAEGSYKLAHYFGSPPDYRLFHETLCLLEGERGDELFVSAFAGFIEQQIEGDAGPLPFEILEKVAAICGRIMSPPRLAEIAADNIAFSALLIWAEVGELVADQFLEVARKVDRGGPNAAWGLLSHRQLHLIVSAWSRLEPEEAARWVQERARDEKHCVRMMKSFVLREAASGWVQIFDKRLASRFLDDAEIDDVICNRFAQIWARLTDEDKYSARQVRNAYKSAAQGPPRARSRPAPSAVESASSERPLGGPSTPTSRPTQPAAGESQPHAAKAATRKKRMTLYRALKKCTSIQFEELLMLLPVDTTHIQPAPAEIATRAQGLIKLVEQDPVGLEQLRAALLETDPALLGLPRASDSHTAARSPASANVPADRVRVLLIAANPPGTDRIGFDREFQDLKECLERATHGSRFDIEMVLAADYQRIAESVLKFRPNVLHFSGHAREDALYVERRGQLYDLLDPSILRDLLAENGDDTRVVVLNACDTSGAAANFRERIPATIGMRAAVLDSAAQAFSLGFYRALGDGRSVASAFRLGVLEIRGTGLSDADLPELHAGDGVDVEQLFATRSAQKPTRPQKSREQQLAEVTRRVAVRLAGSSALRSAFTRLFENTAYDRAARMLVREMDLEASVLQRLGDDPDALAKRLVNMNIKPAVRTLEWLAAAMREGDPNMDLRAVEELLGELLPYGYRWELAHEVGPRLTAGQVVDVPAATETVAEIILAGADERPALFSVRGTDHMPVGRSAVARPVEPGLDEHGAYLDTVHHLGKWLKVPVDPNAEDGLTRLKTRLRSLSDPDSLQYGPVYIVLNPTERTKRGASDASLAVGRLLDEVNELRCIRLASKSQLERELDEVVEAIRDLLHKDGAK